MSCKLNFLLEEGTFVQAKLELARVNGLKELMKVNQVCSIALRSCENIVNVGIRSWDRSKVCGNHTLENCW